MAAIGYALQRGILNHTLGDDLLPPLLVTFGLSVILQTGLLGLVTAGILTRWIATLLFGVTPLDPVTFAMVAVVIGATATIAAAVPAWRAARVDPVVTFRDE